MPVVFPDYVSKMIARLRECGFSAYAVGGCIRDSLIGRVPNDWDITTSSLPEQTAEVFSAPPFRVRIDNGLRHGTVTVFMDGQPCGCCEITTFRCDGTYSDHRRPDSVSFVTDLREDLARRDFTVNAMAAAPAENGNVEFHDPFGGQGDLKSGILRCVGEPNRRFTEDALRIMRGMRFSARYGFTIESKTAQAMHALSPLLAHIAPERLGTELGGFLMGDACGRITEEFPDILRQILPCCSPENTSASLSRTDDALIRLAILCRDADPDSLRGILKRLAFGKNTIEAILLLLRYQNASLRTHRDFCAIADAFGVQQYGTPGAEAFFRFRYALAPDEPFLAEAEKHTMALFSSGECYNTATLAITGRDLITAGIPAGPAVGEMLQRLADAVIAGEAENRKDMLLSLVRQLIR